MSELRVRSIAGKDGLPVAFPDGIVIGAAAVGGVNHIGVAGQAGFGAGVCPGPLPAGMLPLPGYADPLSDNYGNYVFSDGSQMVWVPAYFYKWGTGANGLAANECDIKPFAHFASVAAANAAGYALERAFYDGGAVQPGVFVDKYLCSNNNGVASSIKNRAPLSPAQRGSLAAAVFSALIGAPASNYGGAIAAAKTRGVGFFCNTRFIWTALARLAYAHARASTGNAWCAWHDAVGVKSYPKGCNNDALGDANDGDIRYLSDGNGTYNSPLTGSANLFARTTHNGQNSGVADLNGGIWQVTPGLTSDGANLFTLKTSARMRDLTGSNALATDLWGAAGLATLYDNVGATWGALADSNTAKYFGSATQVFSSAAAGNDWSMTGLGVPLAGGVGGTNAFGGDGLWDYAPSGVNELCPLSGAYWDDGSMAGVWALNLASVRANASASVGFRAALYL